MKPNTYKPGGQNVLLTSSRLFAGVVFLFSIIACTGYADAPAAPETGGSTRLDRCHLYLSSRVLRLAEFVNNGITATVRQEEDHESEMTRRFYGNLLTSYEVEGSYIRVTPRLIMTEGDDTEYKLDFSARLRLPNISERLRLYADSYDTDYDTMEEIFSPRYRQELEDERSEGATTGLAYFFSDRMTRQLSLSTGLRFRPQPSPKLRLLGRLRKSLDIFRADISQSAFWSEQDGFGEKTEFKLERPYGKLQVFRLQSSLVWSELSHGVDWGQSASYSAYFSPRSSAALKVGARGYSHPSWITDQYLVRIGWRKRVHRDWMFLEIEPGLDFFCDDDFDMTPLISIKLEVIIGSFTRL